MGVGGKTPCNKPNCKCLRSSFGPQTYSTKYSQPSYGFGTGVRDAADKMYISPQHARAMVPNNSLGPMYKIYSSIGDQVESNRPNTMHHRFGHQQRLGKYGNVSSPGPGQYQNEQSVGIQHMSQRNTSARTIFGTSTRDANKKLYINSDLNRQFYGLGTPGPNTYQNPSSMGRQALSTKDNGPYWKMGQNKRFNYDYINRAQTTPGVGSYKVGGAIGRQIDSRKQNANGLAFGQATREKITSKQFISPAHERTQTGIYSPGPMTGYTISSFGKQNNSTKRSNPRNVFGTSNRLQGIRNDIPGPGTYCA